MTAPAAAVSSPHPFLTIVVATDGSKALLGSLAKTDPDLVEIIEVAAPSVDDIPPAVVQTARGEFVTFLSSRDTLRPDAVATLRDGLTGTDCDIFYTDEFVGGEVRHKPEFSPERLRSQFYWGSFVGYRTALLDRIGGPSDDFGGAQAYELALRAARAARSGIHVPGALIAVGPGERSTHPEANDSVRRALELHLAATGGGTVLAASTGTSDTRRPVVGEPLVSIVIPTRGDSATIRGTDRCLVVEAVRGVVEESSYSNIEIVVVADDVTPPAVIDELRAIAGSRLSLVGWSAPFSFSGKMNLGVAHAKGEFVLFLNDDVEVIAPDWIEALLALAQRPDCGIVGALLYFEDGTIQHAGHAYYGFGVTHIGINSPASATGPGDAFLVEREVDGVTAACAMMTRSHFFEVGGFSTLLPGNFNDVDLCMKLAVKGYHSYVTPHAKLFHFESKSRDPKVAESEIERAWGRWEPQLINSKYWPEEPGVIYRAQG
ncbi:MAG: glycosyltransferase [Rhodoglobus sp.]